MSLWFDKSYRWYLSSVTWLRTSKLEIIPSYFNDVVTCGASGVSRVGVE